MQHVKTIPTDNTCILSVTPITDYDHHIVGKTEGYRVIVDTGDIAQYRLLIGRQDKCCEITGYMTTEDNLDYYIGATLYQLEVLEWREGDVVGEHTAGGSIFLDLRTSKGVLQLAVYNEHNGYYSHPITVEKEGADGTITNLHSDEL